MKLQDGKYQLNRQDVNKIEYIFQMIRDEMPMLGGPVYWFEVFQLFLFQMGYEIVKKEKV